MLVSFCCSDRSSLNPNVYRPTFAGFVDTDISNGKISLRSLVCVVAQVNNKFHVTQVRPLYFLSCGDYFFLQIDRSVVESFGAGGKTCILSRVYPSLAIGKKAHLYVFNNGRADVKVSRLAAWDMKKPLMNGA